MRAAKEAAVWGSLIKARAEAGSEPFEVGSGTTIDLARPCTVLGGRNGAGKSRLLRKLEAHLGDRALLVDLHHLTEQALILYRSRDDFDAMTDEVDPLGPSDDRLKDIQKIVGRSYDSIDWFSLEIEPDDPEVADRFRWLGDQSLIPYFRATYRGHSYTSKDMGLGEFSVHFLFWVLELFREEQGIVLLLDEPDAYLPPVGVHSLLARLLHVCLKRNWSLVLSTHSEEMIALATYNQGFTLLQVNEAGETTASHSTDDPMVAISLLSRPPVDSIVFAEDESACALARALVAAVDPLQVRRTVFLWGGDGDGYLKELHKHLPKPPQPEVRFAYAFDGDQRGTLGATKDKRWGGVFLPTDEDPDELMQSLASEVAALAERLMTTEERLRPFLASIEGEDCHDWVNKLGEEYGRPLVLQVLPALWAELHPGETQVFVEELRAAWS
ncbi:hypothetical protein [Nocardioides sp. SR21]|uniref:hypothetical protein n=1 Tax=Nocardioides sp. SR21 TaxID=2919501 RepID=UPI001FAA05D2|nr:hypothetical protein [Nocardioides sp. SR21]